jgi:hypothetical protein
MTTRSVPAARPYGPTTLLIAKQQKQTLNGSNLSGNQDVNASCEEETFWGYPKQLSSSQS